MQNGDTERQFKGSVFLGDNPVRLTDVAKEFNKTKQLSYSETIRRCFKNGFDGMLPIYIDPNHCLYSKMYRDKCLHVDSCCIIKEAKNFVSTDFGVGNVLVCDAQCPQKMNITFDGMMNARKKFGYLDVGQISVPDFGQYNEHEDDSLIEYNSEKGYLVDMVLENCALGLFGDYCLEVSAKNNHVACKKLKLFEDYFVFCDRKDQKKNFIGIYRLEQFPKDTVFCISLLIYTCSMYLEHISRFAISQIWRSKSYDAVQLNNRVFLCDGKSLTKVIGYLSLPQINKAECVLPFHDVRLGLENLFILNRDKDIILNNDGDHFQDQMTQQQPCSVAEQPIIAKNETVSTEECCGRYDEGLQMLIDYEVKGGCNLSKFFAKIPSKPRSKGTMTPEELYNVDLFTLDCSNLYKVCDTLHYKNAESSSGEIKKRSLEPYFRRARKKLKSSK
jgi:hypothetical protein